MRRLASGVEDSPIAKRGCAPRSSRTTDRPSFRAIIARSEPLKPEPTMAISNVAFMPFHICCTRSLLGWIVLDLSAANDPDGQESKRHNQRIVQGPTNRQRRARGED